MLQIKPSLLSNRLKLFSRFMIIMITILVTSYQSKASVDLAINGSVSVDSAKSGVSFVYTLNYSISSLTDNGQNVMITMTLPTNVTISGGTAGVSFDKSQVASVAIVGSIVTVTMVNPIAAGSTGQLQIALVYTVGTTPNGYTPAISAQITGTNASISPVSSNVSYVKALAIASIQVSKTANTTNATIGNAFTYTISYTNNATSNGGLNLYSTAINDTLPVGCSFVSATAFGSVNYTYDAAHNVVSWKWSNTALSASGNATVTVKYNTPNFNDASVVTNCVTLGANCPVLPLGSFTAITPVTACGSGQLIAAYIDGISSGNTITTIAGVCAGTVMVGTNANFTAGWKNTGNTNLDSVVVTYNVDDNVDLYSVNANYVKDALAPSTPPALLITKYYATNLHPGYAAIGTYNNADIYNGVVDVADTPTLATGEYVTSVKILVTSSGTRMIEPNMSQDLTYTVNVRNGTEGGKSGATLTEGTVNLTNCKIGTQGSYARNCYNTDFYNSVGHKSITGSCTSASIVSASMAGTTTGTAITGGYTGVCSGTVMPGTTITFTEGWKNSGNSNLDSVVVEYNVDDNVNFISLNANYVKDSKSNTPPDLTVTKYYATNLNPVFTSIGTYRNADIYNKIVRSADTLSLAAGEYVTQVRIVTQSTANRTIEPNMNQDLSYKCIVRSAAQGSKSGSVIVEGSRNATNCSIIVPGTIIQNCYNTNIYLNGVGLGLMNTCSSAKIVSALPVFTGLNKAIINSNNNNKFAPGDTVHWQLRMYQIGLGYATNVSWVDSLPSKLSYVSGSAKIKFGANKALVALSNVTYISPKVTFNVDTVKSGDSVWITFDTRIAEGTSAGTISNTAKLICADAYVNGGTNIISGSQSATVLSSTAFTSLLGQNGCDITTYVYYPTNAHATPQGKINYRAVLKNTGNIAAKQVTLVDVFPYIGDVRGSQYFANLSAPITFSDPNIIIYYDTVSNPCLTDFSPAINGAGCKTANWSVVAPADITAVKAIKLTRNTVLNPLDSIVFSWPMVLPVAVPASLIMYNSFTYQLSRADNNAQLLPATPNKVGMVADCIANLGSIGNYVWADSNANGLQDEPVSAGINGIKVYLFRAGPSNVAGGNDAMLSDSTLTADDFYGNPGYYSFINLTGGNYFVKFPVSPLGYKLTTNDQTDKVNGNSDANTLNGNSELITIDVNGAGFDRDNYTIACGYIPCLKAINASVSNVSCYGLSDGALLLTPVSNYGTVNYSWQDGANTKDRIALKVDTFTVTATDDLGCSVKGSYIVTQPTAVIVKNIIGADSLCLDAAVLYTDSTQNGFWSATDTMVLKVDSITGNVAAAKVGSTNVLYSLVVGNCTYSATKTVVVTDCGEGVNSGISGGVESKSLGNVIAERVYNKAINSISNIVDYAKLPKVVPTSIMVYGAGGNIVLKDFLPSAASVQSVINTKVDVYTTTPSDLVNFTNALEVQAQDYTSSNVCKAVALSTKTSGMVYAHTKPICDRLRGAQLLDVKTILVNNIGLIQYKLLQEDGKTEFAVSFSAGRNQNTAVYNIQSIWLNENFTGYDTMFNFQLWSSSASILKSMAKNVMDNLNSNLPVIQLVHSNLPAAYVVSHNRNGRQLELKIRNNTANTDYNLLMNINNTELTSTTTAVKTIPVTLTPFGETNCTVMLNDSYEADVRLVLNSKDADLIYTNDGTWNISYSNTATINKFTISNDTLTPGVDEWRLFRNATVDAVVSDYVSVYKLLKAAGVPKDITVYKGLKFTASCSGAGSIKITLVKNSIADWNNQYSITVPVQAGTKDYVVSLSDFAAAGIHGLIASDITTINFAFQVNSGNKTNVVASLNNVKFTKYDAAYLNSLTSKNVSLFPNPSNGNFTCRLMSDKVANYTMRVINATTGGTVFTMPVSLTVGENKIAVSLTESARAHGVYLLKLEGLNGESYNSTKLVIVR